MSHNPRGWCSNRECPCWTNPVTKPCPEWMGHRGKYKKNDIETWGAKYCMCCGFERADHRPLISNGRKP